MIIYGPGIFTIKEVVRLSPALLEDGEEHRVAHVWVVCKDVQLVCPELERIRPRTGFFTPHGMIFHKHTKKHVGMIHIGSDLSMLSPEGRRYTAFGVNTYVLDSWDELQSALRDVYLHNQMTLHHS